MADRQKALVLSILSPGWVGRAKIVAHCAVVLELPLQFVLPPGGSLVESAGLPTPPLTLTARF